MAIVMPDDSPSRVTDSTADGLTAPLTLAGFLPDQMARLYEQFCAPIITVSGTDGDGDGNNTGQPVDN